MLHKALATTTETCSVAPTKSGVRHWDTGYWKQPHPLLSTAPSFHMFLISGYLPAARCSFPLPPSWTCRPFFWAGIIACRFQEYLPLFDAILVPPLPWLQSL